MCDQLAIAREGWWSRRPSRSAFRDAVAELTEQKLVVLG